MFDNGNFRPEGDYSRALELELDFQTMTARRVWEYRHQPDILAVSQSSATRLPNGNTLVNFGNRDFPDEPVVVVEATPDGDATWQLDVRIAGRRASSYRAYPLSSLAGETSVGGQ